MKKYFIITVDTEGDNLWNWKLGDNITTKNANYILRFQELCEKYNLIPVYLVNYEMVLCEEFVQIFKKKAIEKKCEIGMHLHAWNTPPEYELENIYGGQPFIIEYSEEIIYKKHVFLKSLIEEKFGMTPVSYRAGRWATSKELFKTLDKLNFLVDCSITPGISHKNNKGRTIKGANNYTYYRDKIRRIGKNLIEVPMTTIKLHRFKGKNLKNKFRNLILGQELWLRTANNTYEELKKLIEIKEKKGSKYLQFMIHSSELMAKGSPYFLTENSIEEHYNKLENLFKYIKRKDYSGISLKDFREKLNNIK